MNSAQLSVQRILSVVPAGAGPWIYKVDFSPGIYRVGLSANTGLGAGNTTVAIAAFLDEAKTIAAPPFYIEGDVNSTFVQSLAFPSGLATGKTGRVLSSITGTAVPMGDPILMIANGLQITITKGSSASGEKLELDLLISQMRDAIAVPGITVA